LSNQEDDIAAYFAVNDIVLWDTLSSLPLIQSSENEGCQRICKTTSIILL